MAKSQHVVKADNGWAVRGEGNSRASAKFDTQSDAVAYARSIAQSSHGEIIIHGRDGKIRGRDSYGNDPCPPRNK
jgi:uncharacterized protein YdaT